MNVCVFCGSGSGFNPAYSEAARKLGVLLADASVRLIYGGGNIGLMGTVADAVMGAGGKVTGVIPAFLLEKEVGHRGITDLEVVESMHQRKQRMADLADAFVALPGGWGTLEELSEILTWKQLGLISQPIAILNTDRFFDPLLDQMRLMVKEGFLKSGYFSALHVESDPEKLLSLLIAQKA
ncbi:MAG TPA: TIGR00730 family Rossman fold protein [Chryseosolibacter sp.]|nr:TIGR00730 family Rossman fold protein [Chryseosolibacter sp.]